MLLTHGMMLLERRLRDKVSIDGMQFGFMPWKGMTDAIFIIRHPQERFLAKQIVLFICGAIEGSQ